MPTHRPHRFRRSVLLPLTFLFITLPVELAAEPPAAPAIIPNPAAAGFTETGLAKIRAAVQARIDKKEFAGINVILFHHGQVGMAESFGFADLDAKKPLTQDTIMRISLTKPICSTAAMICYDDGKFKLDDPVSKYIPGFADVKVKGADGVVAPAAKPLLVRNLLQHTSGIPAAPNVFRGSLADMERQVTTLTLNSQPGDAWVYSSSLDVVARLVEVWSGKPFDQFLQERIFGPLAMNDTGYVVPPEKVSRVSAPYRFANDALVLDSLGDPARKPTYFAGSSGLFSTSLDYLRFGRMLLGNGELDGKRILKKETVDLMMTSSVPTSVLPAGGPNGRLGFGYGIGGAVLVNPQQAGTLSAPGEFNWGGASGVFYWVDRKNDTVGVWFVQRQPWVQPPSAEFRNLAYEAMVK